MAETTYRGKLTMLGTSRSVGSYDWEYSIIEIGEHKFGPVRCAAAGTGYLDRALAHPGEVELVVSKGSSGGTAKAAIVLAAITAISIVIAIIANSGFFEFVAAAGVGLLLFMGLTSLLSSAAPYRISNVIIDGKSW